MAYERSYPVTERDAALVRDLALAFAAGKYEGGETLFEMYANIALKFMETRGLAQTQAEPASAIADITRRLEDVIVMINSPGEYSRVYVAGACRVILGLIESLGHAQTPADEDDETIARRLATVMHGDDVEWHGFLTKAHHWMALSHSSTDREGK
jgi:hypothetical protein